MNEDRRQTWVVVEEGPEDGIGETAKKTERVVKTEGRCNKEGV